jgi:predicted nucleic acid-binding protein
MYCLDTDVWVYFFDAECPEHDQVVTPVRSLLQNQPLFSTTVLQMEVVHYLHTQLADSSDPIRQFLELEDVTVAEPTTDDVTAGVSLLDSHGNVGIGGRDATVVAAMDRHGVTTLWTHDSGLSKLGERLDWLEVVDPVTADSEAAL